MVRTPTTVGYANAIENREDYTMKLMMCAIVLFFVVPAWGQYVDPYVQPINPYQFAPLTPVVPLPYPSPPFYDEGRQQFQLDNLRWEQKRANEEILQELRQAKREHERDRRRRKRLY